MHAGNWADPIYTILKHDIRYGQKSNAFEGFDLYILYLYTKYGVYASQGRQYIMYIRGAIHVGVAAPLYIYTLTMASAILRDAIHVKVAAPLPFFDDRYIFRLG